MKQIYCLLKEGKYGVTRFSKKKYIKYKIYRTIILLKKKKNPTKHQSYQNPNK